jgi:hypothetical protein
VAEGAGEVVAADNEAVAEEVGHMPPQTCHMPGPPNDPLPHSALQAEPDPAWPRINGRKCNGPRCNNGRRWPNGHKCNGPRCRSNDRRWGKGRTWRACNGYR